MEEAIYIVTLAKGCPALFTRSDMTAYDYIRHELPLAQGHALLHALRILDGQVMIWPQLQLSRLGRWWQRVRAFFRRRREQGGDNRQRIDTDGME